ncbi:MAG TPA: hypothetical protein VGG83_10885 [Trebonia sp.]
MTTAADRITAYLDIREQWAERWDKPELLAIPIVTQPRLGLEGPSWLELTHADLREVLHELDEARSTLTAVRAVAEDWHQAAINQLDNTNWTIAQVLHALDGDTLTADPPPHPQDGPETGRHGAHTPPASTAASQTPESPRQRQPPTTATT